MPRPFPLLFWLLAVPVAGALPAASASDSLTAPVSVEQWGLAVRLRRLP